MSAPDSSRPFLLGPGEGEAFWSLGGRFAIKVGSDLVDGRLALVEASLDRGGEPPLHIHHREDEIFYVVDGQLTFHVGGERLTAASGALAFAPRGIAHAFTVDVEPSRVLVLTSPAGFEAFVRARGVPAVGDVPPPGLAPPDSSEAREIQERFGIEIIGPPRRISHPDSA